MTRDDIIRLAERAGIVFRLTSTDVTVEKLERFLKLAQAPRTRGFLWFWLRPEGGMHKPGLNLTLPGNGFVLTLYTQRLKYRFRFRRGMKPHFSWSNEPMSDYDAAIAHLSRLMDAAAEIDSEIELQALVIQDFERRTIARGQ